MTYVAYDGAALRGFSRSLDDNGIYLYVCDLLVANEYRCRGIGGRLMVVICRDYPGRTVYVMSDVDAFYEKKGYRREGSVFEVIASADKS